MNRYPARVPHHAPPRVLVAGGTGFIGRHAVAALRDAGAAPIVGSRSEAGERVQTGPLTDDCARRVLRFEDLCRAPRWLPLLEGVDVVLNCVGILRPRGRATYARVHHAAVAALAAACAQRGIRLVHVSALGLEAPVRSGFLRSKRLGEQAVMASGADWWIARPALLDGDGGFGSRWIRRVAGRAVDTPHHWLPSTASFVEAARLGIGWGMNPEPLVRPLIAAGELVELVPGRPLDTPLHWQHPRLSTDTLDRLTQAVAAAAKTLR